MKKILLKHVLLINEGQTTACDVLIQNERIEKIASSIADDHAEVKDCKGMYLLPGCIDDQVHFREPGLTHKADIYTESRAAVAGGITSYMEMPNTVPNTLNQRLLEEKYAIAANSSLANYSFYMGASNDNIEEVLKTDEERVCGVKVFMGSSTGNMLVDNEQTLEGLFSRVNMLIATHCEDEATIRRNLEQMKSQYGDSIPVDLHPIIRSEEACYISSSLAVSLAKKHGTRLHVLHISTAKELDLFASTAVKDKRITAEACVHHLWFSDEDYAKKGNLIKWNPAVKKVSDRDAILKGVLDNRIDVIATDHAPHTLEEKSQNYMKAPSGGPLVQHALLAMLDLSLSGKISIEKVVEKMAHAPATLFNVIDRGFVREGYFADLVLVDPNNETLVTRSNNLYKCGWSPFEGHSFSHQLSATFVNGQLVFDGTQILNARNGQRLLFHRR